MALGDLLARGFFPKELPAPLATVSFANVITAANPLPGDFGKSAAKNNNFPPGKIGRYSLARGGLFRRQLAICNPLHYFALCREMTTNWAAVSVKVGGTPLAATTPDQKTAGRAIDGRWPQSARPDFAREHRVNKRYILITDITRFYGVIYTHSIPWALHTKSAAKTNRTMTLLGNRLDYWLRMGQDQQTVGIPIGPDTSLVIAELILQRCDEALLAKLPALKGYRFIDDYELCFWTRTEAEDAYHLLESCLAEYELTLNAKKTEILELPLPLERPWATELKLLEFRSTQQGQMADLSNYFDRAFLLHGRYPGEPVLQFAIARLRSLVVPAANWGLFQKLLLLCVAPEPATFPYVLEQIILRKNAGAGPVLPEFEQVANQLAENHSVLRHSSEVANAVWACLSLRLHLGDSAVDSISKCDDPVVALLALHCEREGLLSKALDTSLWATHMTPEGLYDEYWLLSYEANVKGWLPTVGGGDHVAADANFGYLKTQNVEFYDTTKAVPVQNAPIPLPSLPTISTVAAHTS